MKKVKTSLVLEGGGMRGAYTAGALSWLIDNNIEFDNAYGISTGAVHLCNFLLKDKKKLFDVSTKYIADENAIGLKSILRCGYLVDYDYIFNNLLVGVVGFDIKKLKDIKTDGKIGIYELKSGMAEYHSVKDLDIEELKAACTLPLLGKMAKLGDRQMLDAGISKMIPIEEAIKDGCDKHIIITTKPGDYVRKPSNKAVVEIMRLRYADCPNIAKDYEIRHRNYYIQISSIKNLVEEGKALYIYPSKSSKVSRLGGSQEELAELYELGRSDMEARKDEIFKLLGKKK